MEVFPISQGEVPIDVWLPFSQTICGFNMDPWYEIERTLTQAANSAFADLATSIAEGNTPSPIHISFEMPVGDNEALFVYDDNPWFLSDDDDDEDEDEDDTKLDLNPVLLIAVWYCIITSIIIFVLPLMMWQLFLLSQP